MNVERGDLLVLGILFALAIPAGLQMADRFAPDEPDSEIERYCQEVAAATEGNLTDQGVESCRCIPPSQVDPGVVDAPEKVENATHLFMVQCDFSDGRTLNFPVRRIREDYNGTDLNRSNVSSGNTTIIER